MQNAALSELLKSELHSEAHQQNGERDEAGGRQVSENAKLPDPCQRIVQNAPASLRGEELLAHHAEKVSQLPDSERVSMREQVATFARQMEPLDASDMDAGGPACQGRIWYRTDGEKAPSDKFGPFDAHETDVLFLSLLTKKQVNTLLTEMSTDVGFEIKNSNGSRIRFRTTIYLDFDHLALNMRAIEEEVRELDGLGFHPIIKKGMMFRHVRDGLTLITGVTGSGKSSTLDAIVDANNQDVAGHIVVIAKPIEYMHKSKKCIVRNREVGKHVNSFKAGIVQALRQDPDIVVIGEMRDPETISSALEITDSGHKVFSTLHTSSAMETIDRIVAEYPSEEQERIRNRLADVLRCVISQKLPPKIGGGRVLAKEVLWMTSSARAAIKNDNTGEIYQMMWEGGKGGQTTLEQDLFRLVRQRKITPATAMDFANNKKRLKQLIR